jgi:hypothetical protein
MRSGNLEIEQADRRRRKAHRRHRREPRRLHDAAKGRPDRSFHLVQRHDRLVLDWSGKLHDESPLGGLVRANAKRSRQLKQR